MTDLFSIVSPWDVLGWTMLHFLWMGSIVFAVSAGVRWSVRRCSARLRYAAALVCLMGVTGAAAAALSVSWRQVGSAAAAPPPPGLQTVDPPLPADWIQRGAIPALTRGSVQTGTRDMTPAESLRHAAVDRTLTLLAAVLPWIWVCGTPLVILMLLTGVAGTARLRRRSNAIDDAQLLRQLDLLRSLIRVSRRVGVAVCDQVTSPLVIGIVRPLIVLPPAMIGGLAPAQLEMILLHELAHVRRWDNLVNLCQRVVEALLFYHPAVWWASRWVRLEREHCCDALVLAHNHTPQAYAETLATLALPELAPRYATAAMANHQLTSRICHILNVEERSMGTSVRALLGGVVLLAAGAGGFLIATLRPERAAADDPAQGVGAAVETEPVEAAGRFLYGVGVNSDAGVSGQIMLNDGGSALLGGLAAGSPGDWSATQATGPPDVPEAGDNDLAWASLTEDGQSEWLRLTYEPSVRAAAILVYESWNPGAVRRVTTIDGGGAELVLWEGDDPVAVQDGKGVAIITPHQPLTLSEITLHVDSPAVPGWNEIDAVGLIDRTTGEIHWADGAEASSSYAELLESVQEAHSGYSAGNARGGLQCQSCHQGIHGATEACPDCRRERINQLRSELQRLEVELAHEEALHAQVEQDQNALLQQRQALDAWINAAWWPHSAETPSGPPSAELQELRQTLEVQQQAIERLTDVLEQLRQRLNSGDEGAADSDPGTESGASIMVPAIGPSPLALDFTFPVEPRNAIDEFVLQQYQESGIQDSEDFSDEEFLRRVYLDVLGRLPTEAESQQFLEDPSPTARKVLIERLVRRSDDRAEANRIWRLYFGVDR